MNFSKSQSVVSAAIAGAFLFCKGGTPQFAAASCSIVKFSQQKNWILNGKASNCTIKKDFRRGGQRPKDHYNSKFDEVPLWPTSEELSQMSPSLPSVFKPAEPVVKEILEKLAAKGKTVLLPWADELAMQLIVQPFQKLLDTGVDPEFLVDMCLERQELFRAISKNGEDFVGVLASIKNVAQMTYREVITFAADWANELATTTPDDVEARFRVFLGRGVEAGREIRKVIEYCPMILFDSTPQKMDTNWEAISNFFSAKDVLVMCCVSPHICLIPYKELELRYEYIYGHMGIEPGEFLESRAWPEMDLKEIMMRHSCIKKTGRYVTPDEKRPQLKMENPPMNLIFDTDDQEFAGVAGISKEEWLFFKQVYERQESNEDKERPYEKIKASTRKQYERRVKDKVQKMEGEL